MQGIFYSQSSSIAQIVKFSIKDFFSKCDQIAVSCGFGHIYCRNPWWKIPFFVQWFRFSKPFPLKKLISFDRTHVQKESYFEMNVYEKKLSI